MNEYTATYSPDDNKCRLYAGGRLPSDVYARVRAAGFIWAPKQELFVAPMWTPEREDLLLELCGEIGDEDKTLVDRAEERADRFQDYSASRRDDADAAHKAVESICEHIPLGQPILVGHHSERHARKDAERIENGMRRAVKMWEQSQYWADRAKGSIRAAKYKERPDVRARRIKKIEAEKRGQERAKHNAESALRFWEGKFVTVHSDGTKTPLEITEANKATICRVVGSTYDLHCPATPNEHGSYWSVWDVLQPDGERYTACPSWTVAQCQEKAFKVYAGTIARCDRWIAHYDNRMAYERAMLVADGGTATDKKGPEKGGAVKCWASVRGCWSYIVKVNRVSVTVLDNWGNGGGNFTRTIPFDKCFEIMSAAEVQAARDSGRLRETSCKTGFGLCGDATEKAATETTDERNERAHAEHMAAIEAKKQEAAPFKAMQETLKAGVQVVTAPNLFPTPPDVAKRMVELAEVQLGMSVLEPSAGTGNILQALKTAGFNGNIHLDAIEINPTVYQVLRSKGWESAAVNADFLEVVKGQFCPDTPDGWDRILMNPPFDHGSDIAHIKHALTLLKAGGRLVAICANGPRQQEQLKPLADQWIDLPDDTFKAEGTGVRTALLVINH